MAKSPKTVAKKIVDKNGVTRTVYVLAQNREDVKRGKVHSLIPKYNSVLKKINSHISQGKDKQKAIAVKIMLLHGLRIGNEKSVEKFGTHGLSTLRKDHVKQKGSKMFLDFKGKKSIDRKVEIKSDKLQNSIKWLMGNVDGERLFDESPYEITKYIKKNIGSQYTPKDLRMIRGNIVAQKVSDKISKRKKRPQTKTEANEEVKEILEKVATSLGNTSGVAKRSYVDDNILLSHINKRFKKKRRIKKSIVIRWPKSE